MLLTDQKVIGGLGNAYVDEILWVAKIKHDRIAALMTAEEVRKIHQAIGQILDLALRQTRKGLAGQIHGEVRDYFRVHLRTRKLCPQCGTKIAQEYFRNRITIGARPVRSSPAVIATLDELSGRSNSHANFVKVL
jgi:formamidopyrimidine-DNA glycosylase